MSESRTASSAYRRPPCHKAKLRRAPKGALSITNAKFLSAYRPTVAKGLFCSPLWILFSLWRRKAREFLFFSFFFWYLQSEDEDNYIYKVLMLENWQRLFDLPRIRHIFLYCTWLFSFLRRPFNFLSALNSVTCVFGDGKLPLMTFLPREITLILARNLFPIRQDCKILNLA